MHKVKEIAASIRYIIGMSLFLGMTVFGQTSTFSGTGNWNTAARWSNGIPTSGTAVTIASGANCTVNVAASCASLTFAAVTTTSLVTISGTNSLTVTGLVSMPRPSSGQTCTIAAGAGTLSCGSLTMSATTGARADIISISTGTVSVSGTITTGTTGCQFTFTDAGTMNIGGSFSSTPTLTTATGSTVNYNGAGAQTARVATYNNLTLSGSGVKTFATTPTVNGVLSMEGTATVTVTTGVITYGTSATLQYNTATARTSSAEEWITPFAATGGVIITNTGAITIDGAKVFNAGVPLTINSGATLTTNNNNLTFGGDFVNNGTLNGGSASITITGNSAQNISGFTTTGTVSMTKTGGTATLTGNVNGGALTINGAGGTLNLGTSLTHTFTGIVTLTAGTLNGGSSTLNENAVSATAWNGTGTVFSAGTGTINFGASGNQTLSASATTFNNVTFSGSGVKALSSPVVVNGTATVTGVTVTNNSTLTVSTALTGTGGLTQGTNATLNIGGTSTITTLTATASGNAVVFNGAAQTVNATTYYNLTLSGSGAKTFSSTTVVNDSATINGVTATNNGTLTISTALIGTGGLTQGTNATLNISGTSTITTLTATASGNTVVFNGAAQTVNATTYYNLTLSGSGAKTLSSTIAVNGTATVTGVTATNNGTLTVSTALTGTGGLTQGTNATLYIGGASTITTLTATVSGNTVAFNGGVQTVNATTYYNLILSGSGGKTFSSTTVVNDSVTITGVTATNNGTLTISAALNGTGGLTQGTNATLNIGGTSTITTLTASATGNTVVFNGSAQTVNSINFYNLTLSGSGTKTLQAGTTTISGTFIISGTAATSLVAALSVSGDCTIGSGTSLNAAGYGLALNGNFSTSGTFIAGSSNITIGGTGTQSIAGFTTTGTVTVTKTGGTATLQGAVSSGDLILTGSGGTLNLGSALNHSIANLTLTNGTLSLGSSTLSASGDFSGSGILTGGSGALNLAGNWTFSGTFNANTSTVNYNGTATDQPVQGGITYYNLQVSNGSTKLVQNGNVTVSNVLTLNSGALRIGDYNLILTNASTGAIAGGPFSASTMIQTDGAGYVQKAGGSGGSGLNIVYPVGTSGYYNAFDLTSGFSVTGASTGNIQISAVVANQGSNALGKYWLLNVTGYTGTITSNLRFTYNSGEVHGAQSQYDSWFYNGSSWVSAPGTHTSLGANPFGANVSATSAASISGRWSAGSTAPATSVSFYSYQSGNWSNATSWTSDPSGTLWINPGVPGNSDNVTILNGRTISIVTNNKQVSSLTINSGGILDITSTTGHNFGTVSGQGKMMLSSNTFPGGSFTSFVTNGSGTIEYYNLNNISLSTSQTTYNNLIISNYTGNANSTYINNFSNPTTYVVNGTFSIKNYSTGTETFYFGNPTPSNNLINMTVYGDFSVDAGCSILVNNFASSQAIPDPTNNTTPYPVHTLSLYGNFTNNGSVRFTGLPSPINNAYYTLTTTAYSGTNYGDVQVYFKGATNNSVTCNGVTDFFRLIEEKGTDKTYTLEITSANANDFALYAPNDQGGQNFNGGPEGYGYGAYYKALFIHYGTLKLDENITIPSLTEGGQDFNIIPTAGLWVNGANISTTVSGLNGTSYQASTLYGSLHISAGQFSTGDAAGIVLGTLGTPIITIDGTGILDASQAWTATGGSNQMSYIQNGGTANFRMEGEQQAGPMLNLSNVNAVFIMSGGTMNFTDNTFVGGATDFQIMDIECQAGNYSVTGGAVNFNLPSSATSYTANSTIPFYNLNLSRGTGTGTVTIQWNTPSSSLTVLNDLNIGSNTILNLSQSSIDLVVGHNFTIASGGTYTPGTSTTNTTTFNGTSAQAFNNVGTITGSALNNLTIANSSVTSIISNDVTVNGTLTVNSNATLNDSGRYVYAKGNIILYGSHTGQLSSGGIRVTGSFAQTIDGGGTGSFYNLIIDKPNTTGVSVVGNVSVTGNLRLVTNANFNIGSTTLSLSAQSNIYTNLTTTAQSFDNTHMVYTNGLPSDGGLSKIFDSTHTSFLYPIGTGTSYRPAQISFATNPAKYGSIAIRPILSAHPLIQAAGKAINLYWKTTSSGFSGIQSNSVNQVYYYYASDAPNPSDEVNYIPGTYIAPNWVSINDVSKVYDTSTPREIHFDTVNYIDGEFTCGTSAAFAGLTTYYSNSNNSSVTSPTGADWNAASTWCTGSNTGTPVAALPDNESSASFIIGDGSSTTHKINISGVHHISSGNITILSDGVLDIGATNGHSFGPIITSGTGNGTLRIASNNYFPKGDWGNFLGTSGGTVEYYQTSAGTLNLPTTYTLPSGSTANITGYYNLTTSPYNSSNIILPNTDLTIYNNLTVGYSAGGGTSNCITQLNAGGTTRTLEVKGNTTVNQFGIVQFMNSAAQNFIADGSVTVSAGGVFKVNGSGGAVANSFTAYGNIVNNGTFDLNPGTQYCNLTFTGTASKSLTSTSTPVQTRLYNIAVNIGGSMDSLLNVNIDPTGFQMGSGGLSLQNGTFRLTTNVSMNLSTGAFTIPSTACLSANGGTFNIATGASAADLMLNGKLEILNGTVNVGPVISSASGNAFNIVYASAGTPQIVVSGGALNVYTQVRRGLGVTSGGLNYSQTGGTVTVGGKNGDPSRAVLEILNSGSKFVMSNGTLIIANHVSSSSPFDLDLQASTASVTGGTIQFGLASVTPNQTSFYFQSSNTLNNLALEATTNAIAVQQVQAVNLTGNLTIGGASSYYNTNGLDVSIGGTLTNNNTTAASNSLTTGGYQTQVVSQNTTFNGSADQGIIGTGANRTNFANLIIAPSSGHTVTLSGGTSTMTVNGNLTLTSGTLNDGGRVIYLLGNVTDNAVHVSTSPTAGGLTFIGTVNQVIGGSGGGIIGNVEINNGGHGVNLTENATVNGQLKFTNGYLYINDYALTLGSSAAVAGTFSTSNMILLNGVSSDKGVTKIFPTGASTFTFPIGDNGKYTPCTFNFASNGNSGASIKVIPVNNLHPTVNPSNYTNYLNYYWIVSSTGFSSSYNVTHTYTYVSTDVQGSPAHIEQYNNATSQWSTIAGTISSPTFSFSSTSLLDGSYTIGDAFNNLPLVTSKQSGNWNNPSTWDLGVVPNGNPVVIRAQDSVALSANGATASSVTIYGVLDAENTTFHSLGQVSGSGKIKILSTSDGMFVFPAGSYDSLFANPVSTVEFYGNTNGTLPLDVGSITKPYQNVIFSGTGIKYISSVDMEVKGNLTFVAGSQLNNSLYNKDMYILGNWSDNNTSTGGFTPGTGAVRFSGTALQYLIMASNSVTETFYNLAINNAAGLTIQTGNADVNNQLILTLGNINTSSANKLTINNTATNSVTGGNVTSFVNGPLRKKISNGSSFVFPVGDAVSSGRNRYGYVSVSSTSTSGTQIWTAQFFDKNPTTDGYNVSNLASPLNWLVSNEYWSVNGPSGGSANVLLSWDSYTGMSSSSSTRAQSVVAEWGTPTASEWNTDGGIISDFGRDSGTVTTSTLIALDTHIFTIGSAVVPVGMLIWAIQNGTWNTPTTWSGGVVPGSKDTVQIGSPYTVTLNVAPTITSLMINNGGALADAGYTMSVGGNIFLDGTWSGSGILSWTIDNDTLSGSGGFSGTPTLQVNGNDVIKSGANVTLASVVIAANKSLKNYGTVSLQTITGAAGSASFINEANSRLNVSGALMSTGLFTSSAVPNTVNYNGSGTQTILSTSYYNLQTAIGGTKIAGGAFTVNNNLIIGSGVTFADTGFVVTVLDSVINNGTHTGTGEILLNGTLQHHLSGTGSFTNIELNNSSNGATLEGNLTVKGNLKLTSGIITALNDTLFIGSTGTVARTTGYIYGNLNKYFTVANDSLVYEVGTSTSYLPVTISFGTITTPGSVTLQMVAGNNPGIANSGINPDSTIQRYWVVNGNGLVFNTYNITLNWLSSDVSTGITTFSDLLASRLSNSVWDEPAVGSITSTSITALSNAYFGTFVVGKGLSATFTSVQTGNWTSPSTWDVNRVPQKGDKVIITSPYVVTLTTDRPISKLSVNSGGTFADGGRTLDLYGGFVFSGQWSGSGQIRWNNNTTDTLSGNSGVATGTSTLYINGNNKMMTAANDTLYRIEISGAYTVTNAGSIRNTRLIGDIAGATWINAAGSSLSVADTLLVTGTLTATASNNTVAYTGTLSQSVKQTNYFNLTLGGARTTNNVTLPASSMSIAGAFVASATFTTGKYIVSSNTIDFNGSGAQNIPAFTFNNVSFSTGGTKTATGVMIVLGSVTINSGVTFNGSSTTDTVYGDWNNSGSFTPSTSRIVFAGASASALTGSTTFNDLVANKTGAATAINLSSGMQTANLIMTSGTMQTGSNAVTITGTRSGSGIIIGTVTQTHAFSIGTPYSFEGPNSLITFTGGSTPTSVTMTVTQTAPLNPIMIAANRAISITTTGGSFTATLRLHYLDAEANGLDETGLKLWEYNGSSWVNMGSTANDSVNNYVEVSGLTSLTYPWALGASASSVTVQDVNGGVTNSGDTLVYTVTARNPYLAAKSGIVISDPLSSDFILNPGTISNGGSISGQTLSGGNLTGGTVTWAAFSLNGGATATRTFALRADSTINVSQTISNTAQINYGGANSEYVSVPVNFVNLPNVVITNSVDNTTPVPGDTLTFTVTFKNSGTSNATSVVMTNDSPNNATFLANEYGSGKGVLLDGIGETNISDADPVTVSGSTIVVSISTIPPGIIHTVKFKALVN
jgi:Domain of unknown function DUF11